MNDAYIEWIAMLPENRPEVIIETGTHKGWGTAVLSSIFKTVYTVELCPKLIEKAIEYNAGRENITYKQGHSPECLKDILEEISEPYILFLDAHGSGGDTVYHEDIGRYGSCVTLELNAALDNLPEILVIDDWNDFYKIPEYPDPTELKTYIKSLGYTIHKEVTNRNGWLICLKTSS